MPPGDAESDPDACPVCGGYGVIGYDVPLEDPRFGKAYPCPRCGEETHRAQRRDTLVRLSNLDAHRARTFDSFQTDLPGLSEAQAASLRIAKDLGQRFAAQPEGWLLIQGRYGCGKTHLAAAVANVCVDAGLATLFMTTPDLLDHLRSTFGPSSEVEYDELFNRLRTVPLLVLDDLGSESPTPWALEKLFQIINYRYNYRLPTVITTNADPEQMDERIRSRLSDRHLTRAVKIDAPDYRRAGFEQVEDGLSNLNLYADQTFETWSHRPELPTQKDRDNLRRVFERVRLYAEAPNGWLVLTGTFGCGKTHLAAAIANTRQLQGEPVMFVTAPDLLDHLRATFSPDSAVSYDRLFNDVRNVPLLIIDDLGVENASPWAREKLFQIIDHRYRAKLATVFTMSKTLDEIDARLASRMGDPARSVVLAITAPSYRGQKPSGAAQRRGPRASRTGS